MILEIFNTIMLAVIAVGALGTAYVLRSGYNQTIKGMESINQQLSNIADKLDAMDNKGH